jgi:hypothetical protein
VPAVTLLAVAVLLSVTAAGSMAWAVIDVGSDGTDGTLSVTSNRIIDLSLAVTGSWNQPGNGHGVYDPDKWAVVFKYDSLYVDTLKTVTFTNHPSGAPVVWLVQRGVRIRGTVDVSGKTGLLAGGYAEGGPGGFRGGRGYLSVNSLGSAGMGPGGGNYLATTSGAGGGYGYLGEIPALCLTYGNPRILPLIGGSGGSGGGTTQYGGGSGGGAILIASNRSIYLSGALWAKGGASDRYFVNPSWYYSGGGGSGGGIRLVANTVVGTASGLVASGALAAGFGNDGGGGRIRMEANSINLTGSSDPIYTSLAPLDNDTAVIWPPSDAPAVRVTTVAGVPVPADASGTLNPPGGMATSTTGQAEVLCEATNVPTTGWKVTVRVVLKSGAQFSVDATLQGGSLALSTWRALLPQSLPASDVVVVQARAMKLP